MKVTIADLMSTNAVTLQPHMTVQQVKEKFTTKKLSTAPVVDNENHPIGVISNKDLIQDVSENTPVSNIMTEKVFCVPEYENVDIAARIMRNHRIHHLIVTKEKKVVGILSSFDLLKLVENKKFVMKNAPTAKKRGQGARKRSVV